MVMYNTCTTAERAVGPWDEVGFLRVPFFLQPPLPLLEPFPAVEACTKVELQKLEKKILGHLFRPLICGL